MLCPVEVKGWWMFFVDFEFKAWETSATQNARAFARAPGPLEELVPCARLVQGIVKLLTSQACSELRVQGAQASWCHTYDPDLKPEYNQRQGRQQCREQL